VLYQAELLPDRYGLIGGPPGCEGVI